jgi:hypothetical protein
MTLKANTKPTQHVNSYEVNAIWVVRVNMWI